MNLSEDEAMETCRIPKRMKVCDEERDFLNDLPEEILLHILSFLPIGDAIKTVLLRRFGNLWRYTSVLDFNDCLHHVCGTYDYDNEGAYYHEEFVDLIRKVLDLHEGNTIDKLRLKLWFAFHYTISYLDDSDFEDEVVREKSTGDEIDKLIGYAISKNVKVLDLNLRGCSSIDYLENYVLPDVLRSNYLTEMQLVGCDFRSCTTIDLKSLKVLFLDEVTLTDEMMEKILFGCPSLEDLSLVHCFGLRKLTVKNPNLKKVMLTLWWGRPLVISCPNVKSLKIYGCLESAQVLDVSPVVDPSIFFSGGFNFEKRSYDDVERLLQKFSKCTTFTPCTWTIMVMTIWSLNSVRCPSFKWKNLILKISLTKWHHQGLSLLLRRSKSLEMLTMYIYPGCGYIFTRPEAQWIKEHDLDVENYWNSQVATFSCLETIMIYGYINEPGVMEMVKFLLRSAVNLQKMVISTTASFKPIEDGQGWLFERHIKNQKDHFTSVQLLELSQKLLRFPRASTEAVIEFS